MLCLISEFGPEESPALSFPSGLRLATPPETTSWHPSDHCWQGSWQQGPLSLRLQLLTAERDACVALEHRKNTEDTGADGNNEEDGTGRMKIRWHVKVSAHV